MRVLVTGGSGFLGRNLVPSLWQRHEVFAPRSAELDITDFDQVLAFVGDRQVEAIVHMVGRGQENGLDLMMRGFTNIAGMHQRVDRIIHIGSGAEFGKHQPLDNVPESSFGNAIPRDSYGFGKYLCHRLLTQAGDNVFNLRPFGMYGKHESPYSRFVSNTLAKAILGLPITLAQNTVFDFLYVDDFVEVVLHALDHPPTWRDINLTPTHSVELWDLIQTIERIHGKPLDVTIEKEGYNMAYTGANQRLRQWIPNIEFTPIEEGLHALYTHLNDHRDQLDKSRLERDDLLQRARIHRTFKGSDRGGR